MILIIHLCRMAHLQMRAGMCLVCTFKGIGVSVYAVVQQQRTARVKMFNDAVHVSYIYKAGKPKPGNYRRAMQEMGTDATNTIFVGDQIFTDVYGANLAGIRTILVKPIHPKEEIQIVLKRYLEKIVLFFYARYQKKQNR